MYNIDSLKIDPVFVASISTAFTFKDVFGKNNIMIKLRVDNLFNKKYEVSGYGWIYGHDNATGTAQMIQEGEYYVAPERSVYAQIKMELF